jgi:PKD repeat protein
VAVTNQTTDSQDVTEEYIDLNSQLTNLQATEQQLLTIMQKAGTIPDVLSVQNQLTSVQSQIEQTKGRMQYLQGTSSTSLLNVTLEQAALAVSLSAQKTQVRAGETVSFTPEISGGVPPYSYQWDFGDGERSTEAAVNHQYNSSGNYTVSLKVTDDRGNTNTGIRTSYITVAPGWNAGDIAGSAWGGLIGLGRVLLDIIIWLGIFSPVWILGAGIPLYIRYRRKRKIGKKPAAS